MSADKITPEGLREFEGRWHPQGFDAWWAREMEYQGFTSAHDGARRAWHECSRAHAAALEENAALREQLAERDAENSKLRSALEIVHFKREPWQ